MSFKQELVIMRCSQRQAKYPSSIENYEQRWAVLDAYKPPFSSTSMEKLVVEFLRLKGHSASKVDVQGTLRQGEDYKTLGGVIRGKRVFTKSSATSGVADIISTIFGVSIMWEVKYSKGDSQKPEQRKFEAEVVSSGGFYFIIKTVDEFYDSYHELMRHPLIKLNKEYHIHINTK